MGGWCFCGLGFFFLCGAYAQFFEFLDHLLVGVVVEECGEGFSHFGSDVGQAHIVFGLPGEEFFQVVDSVGEGACGDFAHVADAQGVDESVEWSVFAGFYCVAQVFCGFFAESGELGDACEVQPVDIRDLPEESMLIEEADGGFAHPHNIHGFS